MRRQVRDTLSRFVHRGVISGTYLVQQKREACPRVELDLGRSNAMKGIPADRGHERRQKVRSDVAFSE